MLPPHVEATGASADQRRNVPVTEAVARISGAFRVSPRIAAALIVVGLLGLSAMVALATRLQLLQLTLAMAGVAVVTAISFRWPLLTLAGFAALIPIEEVLLIDGIGTLSRFAGILFAATYGLPRIGRLAFGALPPAAWAYLAWAVVSFGWALDAEISWAQIPTLVQLFLIAFLVADFVIQRPSIVRPVMWVYSISAVATAIIGISVYIDLGSAGAVRAATFEEQNPAQFAAILLPAVVFGLYEVVGGGARILGGVVALVTILGVVVSGTRGAWVAVAVAFVYLVVGDMSVRRRVLAVGTVIVASAVIYQFPGVADLLSERFTNAVISGGAGRTDIWSIGAQIYESYPVLGVGYANFPVANTIEVVRAASASFRVSGFGPHNLVVGTLIELGPIGLLLLGLFVGPLLIQRGWGPNGAAIRAILASLMTLALFLDIVANRKQVWLVIGIAAGLAYLARRRAADTTTDPVDDERAVPVTPEMTRGPALAFDAHTGPPSRSA